MSTLYNFTKSAQVGHWETKIDPVAQYGYFEHDVEGEGGGLWFVKDDLVDYDGVACLPKAVFAAIEQLGFKAGEDFK
jgi:hypothetical protein